MVAILTNLINRECWGYVVTSLSIGCDYVLAIANISSTMTNALPWSLLATQHDFWKPKSQIATMWAFYAPIVATPIIILEPNPINFKLLNCVLCYHVDPLPRVRGGILNYKLVNKILSLLKHLETNHHKVWIEWDGCEKNAL
jgi:hypothetical protein